MTLDDLKPLIEQASKSKRGRKAKAKPIKPSRKLELDYTRALLAIVDDMHSETVKALMPLAKKAPKIGDSKMVADSLFSDFTSAFSKLTASIKNKVSGIAAALASTVVGKQKAATDKQLIDMIKKQTGLELSALLQDELIAEAIDVTKATQISLINSIPQQYFDRLEQAVLASIQGGAILFNQDLEDAFAKIESLTLNRARLIARDQLGKINSQLSRARQQSLGITHYTWVTMRDTSVRGAPNYYSPYNHNKRDRMVFSWDDPPGDGHPGQPIRCRCVAVPYVAHLTGGPTAVDAVALQPPKSEIT